MEQTRDRTGGWETPPTDGSDAASDGSDTGGCGCRSASGASATLLLLVALAVGARRRR